MDGAHNVPAMRAFLETWDSSPFARGERPRFGDDAPLGDAPFARRDRALGRGSAPSESRPGAADALFIVGMLADKDVDGMLDLLASRARRAVAVRADSPRALGTADLARRMESRGIEVVARAENAREALQAWESDGAGTAALCGSFYLVGDALKGGVPAYLATHYELGPLAVSLVGGAAFAGHLFPVFLGFKGGKGVATALGVMLAIAPFAALLSAAVFVALVAIKRYVSLGSIIAAAFLPVFLSLVPDAKAYVPLAVFISALIVLKHKENIKRLIDGTENRVFKDKG